MQATMVLLMVGILASAIGIVLLGVSECKASKQRCEKRSSTNAFLKQGFTFLLIGSKCS